MATNKTAETEADVEAFLASVENPSRREDAQALLELMRKATGVEPKMWGPAIVGFGKYTYQYPSGREGEWLRVGFSPRKANLALYLVEKGPDVEALLERLGKHGTGASCIYIKKFGDVDPDVLEEMVALSWELSGKTLGRTA